jgi:hypothetical protein
MCEQLDVSQKSCKVFGVRTTVRPSRFDSLGNPFMKPFRILLLISCLVFVTAITHATTVIPPTFDQLVNDAETIFEGTVASMHSEWTGQGSERHIVTYVTFKIDDPIKGALGAETTLRMFGGTVDGQTVEVADAPRFKLGDRDILFVEHNGTQFIPLVGIMHGRFHVQLDETGKNEIIAKDNGAPVAQVTKLGQDESSAAAGKALSKIEFKAAIRQKLAEKAAK